MNQQEGNYIVYDDTYNNAPLDRLFLDHSPENVQEVKEMLDSSCYIGRYSLKRLYKHGSPTYNIRLHLWLIESEFVYAWPTNGWYNFKSRQVEYKKGVKEFNSWMSTVIYKGVHYITANPYGISPHMHISADKIGKALRELEPTGVIKDGKFRLSRYNDSEVREFIDNNIKFK